MRSGNAVADGQLAATATEILSGALVNSDKVSIMAYNAGNTTETVVLSFLRQGGTARKIAGASLGPGEYLILSNLPMEKGDTLKGVTSNAATVDYVVASGGEGPLTCQVFGSSGARKATQGTGVVQRIPITKGVNGDYTVLDATGAATKFKLHGTVGTSSALKTAAVQNTTNTCVALFEVVLPSLYLAGANLTLTANVNRVVASGTTLTTSIDAEVWKMGDDGAAGSDLCATAVQSFTDTTGADKSFTITGTSLSPGDRLLVRMTGVATEGGNTGTVQTVLNSLRVA